MHAPYATGYLRLILYITISKFNVVNGIIEPYSAMTGLIITSCNVLAGLQEDLVFWRLSLLPLVLLHLDELF